MSDFIRWKEVDILAYLPLFVAKDLEFKTISDADSREHERIRLLLIELLKYPNGNLCISEMGRICWNNNKK